MSDDGSGRPDGRGGRADGALAEDVRVAERHVLSGYTNN